MKNAIVICFTETDSKKTPGVTQLHFVTCMEDMQVKLCNHELEFADVFIKGTKRIWLLLQNKSQLSILHLYSVIFHV